MAAAEFSLDIAVTDNSPIKTEWNLDGDLNGKMTLEDFVEHFRVNHIAIARSSLRQEQNDGFDKNPRTRVDNKFDRDERGLKPFGRIQYFAKAFADKAILELYDNITRRSPSRSGNFKRHNYVFLNSKLVARDRSELKTFLVSKGSGFKNSDKLRFINVTPYSARLEFRGTSVSQKGKNKGNISSKKRFVPSKSSNFKKVKKPNGVYYSAAKDFKAKFGGVGITKHQIIPNGYDGIFIKADSRFRNSYINSPKNKRKKRIGRPYVYTSILITLSEKGVILQ